jgi:hypothetical protein
MLTSQANTGPTQARYLHPSRHRLHEQHGKERLMPPWLVWVSWASLALALACALVIALDLQAGHGQRKCGS